MKIVQAKYLVSLTIFLFGIVAATAAKDTVAIIDAGSSGSRLYIFEVDKSNAKVATLHSEKREPGLSKNGATQIDSLLNNSKAAYIKSQKIPLYILATAGMRMLDSKDAGETYKQITSQIRTKGYKLDTAMTISGRYEGLYAWLATGVKNGNLGISNEKLTYHGVPFGIIELGGASMQQTFPVDVKNSSYINRFGTANIYSKSYLGWGIDEVDISKFESKNAKYNVARNIPGLQEAKIIWYQLGGGFIKDSLSFEKKYKTWLLKDKPSLQLQKPKGEPEWTEGAVIDIIINKITPEGFNYENPN